MLQLCGCVPYFYPDFPKSFIEKHIKLSNYTNSTGFCFWDNLKCLSENRGKNLFLSPEHDKVVTIKSWNFFPLQKFGIVWVYIDLIGVVIWQHIHPSTLHS